MIISLTGFMGCGKSSVGRELSKLLCCRFLDLDTVIEERAGKSIADIFADEGEETFRRMEHDILHDICCSSTAAESAGNDTVQKESNIVLSLGGGAIMHPESKKTIHEHTFCVYLRASVDTLISHLAKETASRPLLSNLGEGELRERILKMMSQRSETYERTAHLIIDIDNKSIDAIAAGIASKI